MNTFLQLLTILYAGTGIVLIIGYIPTIKDLLFHKRKSANITSYLIWSLCGAVTFLYSIFILTDLLFRIISGLNFICCFIILVLSLRLKVISQ